MQAIEYFDDAAAAASYVSTRAADAAALLNEIKWAPHMTGVLRAEIYGHSILWDITGNTLHAFHTDYELLPKGEDDPVLGTMHQVLAYILVRNW